MASLVGMAKNFVVDKLKVPEATVTDVDFKSVGRDGVTYLAKDNVQNPYRTPIPICEITYVLKSSGSQIASGTIPIFECAGSLKGKATTLLNVLVKVAHSMLLSLARDVGRDLDIDYELEIGLIIYLPILGKFTIPLSSAGEIKPPTLSDLWKRN